MNNNVKPFNDVLNLSLDKFAFLVDRMTLRRTDSNDDYDFSSNKHKQHVASLVNTYKLKGKWKELVSGTESNVKGDYFRLRGDTQKIPTHSVRKFRYDIQDGIFPVWILNAKLELNDIIERAYAKTKSDNNYDAMSKIEFDYIEHKRRELKENKNFIHYMFNIYCETEPVFLSYLCDKPLPKLGGFLYETIYVKMANIDNDVFLDNKDVNEVFAEVVDSIKSTAQALEKDSEDESSLELLRYDKTYIRNALGINENGIDSLKDVLYVSQQMLNKDVNTARDFLDIRDLAQLGIELDEEVLL